MGEDIAAARTIYQDPAAPLEARVADLFARLTLEEKVALCAGASAFALEPIPRLGVPRDIANMVVYLASDLSSFITGQVISVDGGILAALSTVGPMRAAAARNPPRHVAPFTRRHCRERVAPSP